MSISGNQLTGPKPKQDLTAVLDELLRKVLDEMAPGVYGILNLLAERELKVSFAVAVIKKPEDAYRLLVTTYSDMMLKLLDRMLMKVLRQEGVYVTQEPLETLRNGDITHVRNILEKLTR